MPRSDNPLVGGNQATIPQLAAAMQALIGETPGGAAALADQLGIKRKNVDNYARGTQQPDVAICRKLAALCHDQRDLAFWIAVSRGDNPPDT